MTLRIERDWHQVEAGVQILRARIRSFKRTCERDLPHEDEDTKMHWNHALGLVEALEEAGLKNTDIGM